MVFGRHPDGTLAREVPPARRIMPLIMRRRNESAVYFEQTIDARRVWDRLERVRAETGSHVTILHLVLMAVTRTLQERPRLNRFVAGGRIWNRRGIWISFSAKKGKSDQDPIRVVKRRMDPAWSLEELVQHVESDVSRARSDPQDATERELSWLFRLPHLVLSRGPGLLMWLYGHGLLPRAFTRSDPLFGSIFVANLGSIDLDAAYHHLYEYGDIPIFIVIGRRRNAVVPGPNGNVETREELILRYTLDERIEDGLYCARALERIRALLEGGAGVLPG